MANNQPKKANRLDLKYSGRNRKFQRFLRDGIMLEGRLGMLKGVPVLRTGTIGDDFFGYHEILFTPAIEKFIFSYLLTGNTQDIPKFDIKDENIPHWAEEDHIYKHIKREIERGADKHTYQEETHNDIKGIRFTVNYPYGSLDYGFFPYSWDEFNNIIESIEAYSSPCSEQDIPVLDSHTLTSETKYLKSEKDHLDSVLPEIPTNTIIDKTVCGCGATYLEITNENRNSIIIEPNVPVIIGKQLKHPNLIGVYGEKITAKDIAERISEQTGTIKIMTTPDSYTKVRKALDALRFPYLTDWFLLFDECEKIVSDIDFRQNIILPIDDFFLFKNKAMVSATPIIVNDSRFEEQGFKVIKIQPLYDHRQLLELKHTNNVSLMFKRTLKQLDEDEVVCVFYNSPSGIIEMIDALKIGEKAHIYCSSDAKKNIKKDGYNVFDTIAIENGKAVLNKYNFFTSRFYSAVDIELDYKPTVMMISRVYKTIPDKTPYSLIDPETEAIQIAGRFRNGIDKIIHITDINSQLEYYERDEFEQYLKEQHSGLHKMVELYEAADSQGESDIIKEGIENTEYWKEGYVNQKNGDINYFRYNNAYLDERLKMIYRYPSTLYKSYMRSEAFMVYSDSEYAVYTEQERNYLLNKNNSKAKRITLLYDILLKIEEFSNLYDPKFLAELKKEYSLYIEALPYLKLGKIKELDFKDSAVKTELKKAKRLSQLRNKEVIKEVYKVFKPNTNYTTGDVKNGLEPILDKFGISYDGRGTAGDIYLYFYGHFKRGTAGAGKWALLGKKFPKVK